MHELWSWIKIGLVLGGTLVALVGMIWDKTAKLARFFGLESNPDKGFWVMMIGAAMLGIGLALFYFDL
jgi:hypothetical protein